MILRNRKHVGIDETGNIHIQSVSRMDHRYLVSGAIPREDSGLEINLINFFFCHFLSLYQVGLLHIY